LGAKHVTGVEGRSHLIDFASKNLLSLGYKQDNFNFIEGDIFDYLQKVEPDRFDTILCFVVLYHTIRQVKLLDQIKRILPSNFILDTFVSDQYFYPTNLTRLIKLINMSQRIKLNNLIHFTSTLKTITKADKITKTETGRLLFYYEDYTLESNTIDSTDLISIATKSLIESLFKQYNFMFSRLQWNKGSINNWKGLNDYRYGKRICYIAQLT
jgi:2-polyprenyl-3-methyl-5-hydroxy-6-metoxy-1,4-benzoquinol methylase